MSTGQFPACFGIDMNWKEQYLPYSKTFRIFAKTFWTAVLPRWQGFSDSEFVQQRGAVIWIKEIVSLSICILRPLLVVACLAFNYNLDNTWQYFSFQRNVSFYQQQQKQVVSASIFIFKFKKAPILWFSLPSRNDTNAEVLLFTAPLQFWSFVVSAIQLCVQTQQTGWLCISNLTSPQEISSQSRIRCYSQIRFGAKKFGPS